MDMILIIIACFIFGLTDKTMPDDETQLYEKPHRIVECGT